MTFMGGGGGAQIESWTTPGRWSGDGAAFGVTVDTSNPLLPVLHPAEGTGTIGIGHVWYEATEGQTIDSDFALSTAPFFSIYGVEDGEIQMMPDVSFYLAFRLGGSEPGPGDVYGWAELVWDGSELQILDSAAENDGVGIIAGQYQQVPEPATLLLFGLGGLGAWLLRRNRRSI
jgi:hypothetical protein